MFVQVDENTGKKDKDKGNKGDVKQSSAHSVAGTRLTPDITLEDTSSGALSP